MPGKEYDSFKLVGEPLMRWVVGLYLSKMMKEPGSVMSGIVWKRMG